MDRQVDKTDNNVSDFFFKKLDITVYSDTIRSHLDFALFVCFDV